MAQNRPTTRREGWLGRFPARWAGRGLWAALCPALAGILGCYNLVTVNVGVNRSAGALAAPLTPEAYCAALTGPAVALKGRTGLQRPELSTEQKAYCAGVAAANPNNPKGATRPEQKEHP